MHNVLAFRNHVQILKCLPLHPILKLNRYAYRKVRFCADDTVSPTEVFQSHCREVQRQNKGLVAVLLEPPAGSYVRPAHRLRKPQSTHRFYYLLC